MANTKPVYGTFANGIPFARVGEGSQTMLLLFGGPGNTAPSGMGLRAIAGGFFDSLPAYTIYVVTRKSGLPEGYTLKEMSDDYAELICCELGGRVAVVVGMSYGGMIAQHFAADHPDLCDHMVIAMATHRLTAAGAQLDLRYAELLSQGRTRAAMASYVEVFAPSRAGRALLRPLLWLLAPALLGPRDAVFRRDVLIEAQAEVAHDGEACLSRIRVPVLIALGGQDPFFSPASAEEMARRLPSATLRVYEGKGHDILNEKQFARDVAAFVAGAGHEASG